VVQTATLIWHEADGSRPRATLKEFEMTEKNTNQSSREAGHTASTRNPEWESYAPQGEGRTDEQIRADVHEVLSDESDMEENTLSVVVQDGMVTLKGEFANADDKERLCEEIREVPSVKGLRDQTTVRTS